MVHRSGDVPGERQGLSMILNKGLWAWIQAWSRVTGTPEVLPERTHARKLKNESVVDQIISIMTTIALNSDAEIYV